jgi:hypothetical protein
MPRLYYQTVNLDAVVANGTRTLALGSMAWASFSVRQDPETSLVRLDDSTATTTAAANIPALSRLSLGCRFTDLTNTELHADMTMPFFALINSYQDTAALRDLYKSTLGAGLGLP